MSLRRLGKRHVSGSCRVDIILTDDACIKRLSGKYRGSFRTTDVLAFNYGDSAFSGSNAPAGEVVISLDTARRQARERSVELEDEIIILTIHGLLHLAGQADESLKVWCEMRRQEFETLAGIL